jgi:hypothetical protein
MRTRLWMAPLLLSVALVACDGDSALEGTGEGADGASGTGGASAGNAPVAGASATGPRTVTLVTGDRITMFEAGRYSIEPAKGRARAVFHTRREHGRLHVVPDEAVRLIAAGLLLKRWLIPSGRGCSRGGARCGW